MVALCERLNREQRAFGVEWARCVAQHQRGDPPRTRLINVEPAAIERVHLGPERIGRDRRLHVRRIGLRRHADGARVFARAGEERDCYDLVIRDAQNGDLLRPVLAAGVGRVRIEKRIGVLRRPHPEESTHIVRRCHSLSAHARQGEVEHRRVVVADDGGEREP
jgi:hypothetical protein